MYKNVDDKKVENADLVLHHIQILSATFGPQNGRIYLSISVVFKEIDICKQIQWEENIEKGKEKCKKFCSGNLMIMCNSIKLK